MAINRFPCSNYASLEINKAEFEATNKVESQLPLTTDYTTAAPCENGMWVKIDKVAGNIAPVAATTKVYGIVYTTEKEYDNYHAGLKNFCKVGGQYPRVGMLSHGDIFTSNCFCYDTTEFSTETALLNACAAYKTTALYAVPVTTSKALKLTATAPASGPYAQICKYYTMPNGEKGLQYQVYM